jgi:membrane fusion protein, multidrug efflux system
MRWIPIVLILMIGCKGKNEAGGGNTSAGGNGSGGAGGGAKKSPSVRADAYIVEPKLLSNSIELTGNLAAYESTEIHPEISGRVVSLHFTEGAYVRAGAMLVKLNDADLQAQLKKYQIQLKTAEQTAKRYEQMLKISGISQQEYDLSLLSINTIKADMDIVKTQIAKTRVLAPYSGKMGLRNISLGAYITPATNVATLRQLNTLKLEFDVPEKYSNHIVVGKTIAFNSDASNANLPARIIATESNITADNRSLRVKAVVERNDGKLLPGGFARVQLPLTQNVTTYTIPSQAIIPKARNKQVIILRNGKAELLVVQTGLRDSSNIEITWGLKTGDTVLTTGLLAIKPGQPVTINKIIN